MTEEELKVMQAGAKKAAIRLPVEHWKKDGAIGFVRSDGLMVHPNRLIGTNNELWIVHGPWVYNNGKPETKELGRFEAEKGGRALITGQKQSSSLNPLEYCDKEFPIKQPSVED